LGGQEERPKAEAENNRFRPEL